MLFPNGDALNRQMWWTDPYFGKPEPRRIIGMVADVDDENVVSRTAVTDLHAGATDRHGQAAVRAHVRRPVRARPAVTRVIREISADQPVERAATLEDVRRKCWRPSD